MGIFFDQDWFDARLRAGGLTRAALAQAAGMTVDEVEMVFADRRELEQGEVRAFARVLSADPTEVATRSGASPVTSSSPASRRSSMFEDAEPEFRITRETIAGIHERMDRLEQLLNLVIQKVDRLGR